MRLLGWMTLSREFEPFLCMQAATSLQQMPELSGRLPGFVISSVESGLLQRDDQHRA
jgi:hypothetical protein